jgi:hypothetical protein
VVENILKAFSRCAASCDWLAWKRAPSSSGHATPISVSRHSPSLAPLPITFVCVLSRELCDSVSDLAAHRVVGLIGQATEQLCADGVPLGLVEREEEVGGLACGRLSGFRRLAPEDDGRKCSRLLACELPSTSTRVLYSVLTEVSCASSICSERPIKSTSGLWATHSSFNCCSAVERCTLSGDWRPCRRAASAVWTSAGRTDIFAVCGWWTRGAAPVSGGDGAQEQGLGKGGLATGGGEVVRVDGSSFNV